MELKGELITKSHVAQHNGLPLLPRYDFLYMAGGRYLAFSITPCNTHAPYHPVAPCIGSCPILP